MKDLKDILNEGILGDVETAINKNDIEDMYPIPGNKEWFTSYDGKKWIVWECPNLIKPLLERIPGVYGKYFELEDCIGLSASVSADKGWKELSLYLATDWSHCGESLSGFTQYYKNGPEAKKMALSIFKHLSKKYVAFEKLLKTAAENRSKMDCFGMVDCIDPKEILKY